MNSRCMILRKRVEEDVCIMTRRSEETHTIYVETEMVNGVQ